MTHASLGDSTTTWVTLRSGRVFGEGRIAPRLRFEVWARTPRERMEVELHVLQARLLAGGERLGDGLVAGQIVSWGETALDLHVPISHAAVDHMEERASGEYIDLSLELAGLLRGRDQNSDGPRLRSAPAVGEWTFQSFGRAATSTLTFQIPRSEWFGRVLQPIGNVNYVSTEIAIPRGDAHLGAAVRHLDSAHQAYIQGDDPAVFSRCRAASEALPGAPKRIFEGLSDPEEAAVLDELLAKANAYFHRGRHVATGGEHKGEFPIDHGDARFALNLARLLVGQTARVLGRQS